MIKGIYNFRPIKNPSQILKVIKERTPLGKIRWWLQQNPETNTAYYRGYTKEHFWRIAEFPSSKYTVRYLSSRPERKPSFLRKINKNNEKLRKR